MWRRESREKGPQVYTCGGFVILTLLVIYTKVFTVSKLTGHWAGQVVIMGKRQRISENRGSFSLLLLDSMVHRKLCQRPSHSVKLHQLKPQFSEYVIKKIICFFCILVAAYGIYRYDMWGLVLLCARMRSVMSDSLWPQRLWLTMLLCPWDSPGKNTGVGSHSLLPGIKPESPALWPDF